ncbi:MAG: hypothetical protein EDM05_002445 [Leptolyngbya sp. IPPAS B-1204]|nr:hypothetical protein [Elainella sp. C42_A2020_010]RNJ67108.1 MAG: hypothetical protein EDM05_22550 [Leptolyngbya sp. IPPAS B-1204]
MKSYFKQHEQSDTSRRSSFWQALRAVWQRFVDFMYDKSDYLLPPEPGQTRKYRERQQGLIDPAAFLPSIEAERQWLEEIYRNS